MDSHEGEGYGEGEMLSYTGQFPLIRPVGHLLPQGEGTCDESELIRKDIGLKMERF